MDETTSYFIVSQVLITILLILSEVFSLTNTPYNGVIQALLHVLKQPRKENTPTIVASQ